MLILPMSLLVRSFLIFCTILVLDSKLGGLIKSIGINVVAPSPQLHEVIRGIRLQIHELVADLTEQDIRTMSISLSHSLNCFKLKFSPDKVDTMVVQAIALLDDTDKNLNGLAMRLKEWYGWHFPELAKIVSDNLAFSKCVQLIGFRVNTKSVDFSEVFGGDETMEQEVKNAAEISMGTEITDEDLENILDLAKCVQNLSERRSQLAEYLRARMAAIAPNLTYMVGEIVGARLIAHAGSLLNLAKNPASTVQILGAEKALFRALKSKKATPKYGLIFHASLVGSAAPKLKGKVSRVMAAKLALCTRVDALGDHTDATIAVDAKRYLEKRLEELTTEGGNKASKSFARATPQKYTPKKEGVSSYNTDADAAAVDVPVKRKREEDEEDEPKEKKSKKSKKSDKN